MFLFVSFHPRFGRKPGILIDWEITGKDNQVRFRICCKCNGIRSFFKINFSDMGVEKMLFFKVEIVWGPYNKYNYEAQTNKY